MPQDEKQAFELLKECAEKYSDFAVLVKSYPHLFSLFSYAEEPEYKFEINPEDSQIIIRHLKKAGCDMYLLFPGEYTLGITDSGSHITFDFRKEEYNEVEIIFFRDLIAAVKDGLKGTAGSKNCE